MEGLLGATAASPLLKGREYTHEDGPYVSQVQLAERAVLVADRAGRRWWKAASRRIPAGVEPGSAGADAAARLWRVSVFSAASFLAGAALFACGSLFELYPRLSQRRPVLYRYSVLWPFLVGSLLFTVGCWALTVEALNRGLPERLGAHTLLRGAPESAPRWRWLGWEPRHADFIGSLGYLLGALCYNVLCIGGGPYYTLDPSYLAALDYFGVAGGVLFVLGGGFWLLATPKHVLSAHFWCNFINFLGCVGFLGSSVCERAQLSFGWRETELFLGWFVGSGLFLLSAAFLLIELVGFERPLEGRPDEDDDDQQSPLPVLIEREEGHNN